MNEKYFEASIDKFGFFSLDIHGTSMNPLIREGRDLIIIKKRPEERLKKYDVVLFRRPGVTGRGSHVLHRILKVCPDGTYWIAGDNCYTGEYVKEEDILGVLELVKRDCKTSIYTKDLKYKIYTRLWCTCYPLRFFILKKIRKK